jgi:hypothetical protein
MVREDRDLHSLDASVEAMLAEHERVAALYRDNADMGERRASMYLMVVSAGSALMLAMAQLGLGPIALLWPSIVLLGGMLILGLLTFQRLVERRVHATEYLRAINRIHCYFAQKDPELALYYYWPPCDDSPSFIKGQSQMAGLRDIIALLNSLFAGLLLGILVYEARPALQQALAAPAGVVATVACWYLQQRYEGQTLQAAESRAAARVCFPRSQEQDNGI